MNIILGLCFVLIPGAARPFDAPCEQPKCIEYVQSYNRPPEKRPQYPILLQWYELKSGGQCLGFREKNKPTS